MKRSTTLLARCLGLAALVAFAPSCVDELDTTRTPPARGTVGEEVFGVFCDRVGAQALREDLSGASFRRVCHPWEGGYADKVDTSLLPPIDPNAPDVDRQEAFRAKMIGRVESLARRRTELVRALDATVPATKVGVKDLDHPDEGLSCNGAKEAMLSDAIADMLSRFTALYHDGTLPRSTQALAKLVESFESSPEGRAAWSRLSARQGYRPIETALGVARPVVAYPRLRDLSNTTLRLVSADANPYALDPKRDERGDRVPEPGPAYPAFQGLLDAAHAELLDSKIDPQLPVLVSTIDPAMNRTVLSRPRGTLETMQELLFTQDKTPSGTAPRFIVRRDAKGFALFAPSMGATAFAGDAPPPPFPFSGVSDKTTRDEHGRALANGKLVYDYVDTNQTYAALLFRELQPLADPKVGTLMDLASGLEASLGARAQREKKFSSGTLKYEGVANEAPILDLVFALGAVLGDKNADATLAMANALIQTKQPELARVIAAGMHAFDMAKKHPEAKIPRETAVWDDILEVVGKIAAEPGLLEEVLESLADPRIAKNLGAMFSKFAAYRDDITYDINDLNGRPWNATVGSKDAPRTPVDRTKPNTRDNRSELMRFLKLISDVSGVTLCNRPEAKLHGIKTFAGIPIALTLPLDGSSYKECEVFKIDDLGVFYLDTIVNASALPERQNEKVKPGVIYIRDKQLRDGLIQIPFYGPLGAAEVELMEISSGIHGFWTEGRSRVIAPKPEWLNRLAFFDWDKDNVNKQTRKHVEALTGRVLGSSACAERVITDPSPTEIDAAPDGKVRGLRQCAEGEWFQQRNPATIFVWEHFEFYDTMRALLTPFARHGKERLFLDLASKVYKVMPDVSATPQECLLGPKENCTRQGLVSYEPLLVELLGGDIIPAIAELARALKEVKIPRCEATDAKGVCTKVVVVTGIDVAAAATRSTVDPAVAKANGITDRAGNVGTKRNDGKPIAQVTPAYLVTNALSAIDRAQDEYEAKNPGTRDRYRKARSDLADRILATTSTTPRKLTNPLVNTVTPKAIDVLRAQLAARCPSIDKRCEWARRDLPKSVEATMTGPLASAGISLVETIRKDPDARRESELLLTYLLDAGSGNDAFANVLASASDGLQLFADDENLVPLYHVLAAALKKDGGLVDAQMALLSKISGKYIDREGREICKREMDPNQLLAIVLKNLVSPIKDAAFEGQSPLEVIIDVVADVNRANPTGAYDGRLRDEDYASVSDNVVEFLVDKERGLEQLYEVVRQGTTKP